MTADAAKMLSAASIDASRDATRAAILAAAESARQQAELNDGEALERLRGLLPEYEILGEVHRGGQGVVYRAYQRAAQRTVAIKVQYAGVFAATDRSRFQREVVQLASLHHPNIVTLFDAGVLDATCWFSMEYVEGVPIDDHCLLGARSCRDIVALFLQVVKAVQHAHLRGVVHRDIKPANILVDTDGVPRILDFGLAKLSIPESAGDAFVSTPGIIVGTLAYMSPEQARGSAVVDARSDIYSLGVVLFELLTGERPHAIDPLDDAYRTTLESTTARSARAVTLAHRRAGDSGRIVDRDLDAIVSMALRIRPEDRYQSADALTLELERYLRGDAVEARRNSRHYLLRQFIRRYRWILGAAAGYALILTAAVIGLLYAWRAADTARRTAQAGLAMSGHTRMGAVARDGARVDQAIQLFDEARRLGESVPAGDPIVSVMLHTAYVGLSTTYIRDAKLDRAVEFGRRAVDFAEGILREIPGDPEWTRRLAISQSSLGRVHLTRSEHPQALELLLAAEQNLTLAHEGQIEREDTTNLVGMYTSTGRVYLKLGRPEDAMRALRRGEELASAEYEKTEEPSFQCLLDWAASAHSMAVGSFETNDREGMVSWLKQAEYRVVVAISHPAAKEQIAAVERLEAAITDAKRRITKKLATPPD